MVLFKNRHGDKEDLTLTAGNYLQVRKAGFFPSLFGIAGRGFAVVATLALPAAAGEVLPAPADWAAEASAEAPADDSSFPEKFLPFFDFNASFLDNRACREADIWKTWICADSEKKLDKKLRLWDEAMRRGFERRYHPPAAVKEAAKAVFAISAGRRFKGKAWGEVGGSGFFFLNPRLFVTALHNLDAFFPEISSYQDIFFEDQNGVLQDFRVKSVLYVSAELDLAFLDVEGYKGPVLQRASPGRPPDLLYLIGYPHERFAMQPFSGTFPTGRAYYGVLPSLFDSHYKFGPLSGLSGGPAVNSQGELEAVVFAALQYDFYSVLFLTNQAFFPKISLPSYKGQSFEEARRRTGEDYDLLTRQIREEDKKLILPYLLNLLGGLENEGRGTNFLFPKEREKFETALQSGDSAAHHLMIDELLSARVNPFIVDMFLKKHPSELWPITYYNLGAEAYAGGDFERACRFWKEAERAGLPYIQDGAVFSPRPLFFNSDTFHIVLCD